jgi:integrase
MVEPRNAQRRARGSIRPRGKASWEIAVSGGKDSTGRRLRLVENLKGTKRDAERRLAELLALADKGSLVRTPAKLTVGDFLTRWLRDYAGTNTRPRTQEGYEVITRCHLAPALGHVPLKGLQPSHLQAYYAAALKSGRKDGRPGGLSARTVLHHHRVLSEALTHAVKWGLVGRNVAQAVDPPRPTRKEMRTLDAAGVHRLLEAAQGTPYHAALHLAIFSGMRRSELCGLRWQDVDLVLGTVSVSQVLHVLRGGRRVFMVPKTAKGRRQIALSPAAVLALRAHKERQEADMALLERPLEPSTVVFGTPDGSPMLPNTLTHGYAKIAKRAGIVGVRLHDMRHTHASLMLRQGVHPKIVQERLGHATISTTLDTYSHVTPGLQEQAALRFERELAAVQPVGA